MTVQHRRSSLPLFAVALAVFAWGFGPLFVKGIDASFNTIVFWRVLIGTLIAVAFAYLLGGRITWRLLRDRLPGRRVLRAQLHLRVRVVPGDVDRQRDAHPRVAAGADPVAGDPHVRRTALADRARVRRAGVRGSGRGRGRRERRRLVAGGQRLRRPQPARLHRVLRARQAHPRDRHPLVVAARRGVHRRVRGGDPVVADHVPTTSARSTAPTGCCCSDSSCSRAWSVTAS